MPKKLNLAALEKKVEKTSTAAMEEIKGGEGLPPDVGPAPWRCASSCYPIILGFDFMRYNI